MEPKVRTNGTLDDTVTMNSSNCSHETNGDESMKMEQYGPRTDDQTGNIDHGSRRHPRMESDPIDSGTHFKNSSNRSLHHLSSAQILLTALEAQYGGGGSSSCLTSSTSSSVSSSAASVAMASPVTRTTTTMASSKKWCSSSDSSWSTAFGNAGTSRGGNTSGNNRRRLQRNTIKEGVRPVVPGIQQQAPSTSTLNHDGSTRRIIGRNIRCGEQQVSWEAYEGSASSNNDCGSDSENDMDFFENGASSSAGAQGPAAAGRPVQNLCTIDTSILASRHLAGQVRKKDHSENEGEGASSKRRRRKENESVTSAPRQEEQVQQCQKTTFSSASSCSASSSASSVGFFSPAAAEQTVVNGITILERSVKSKLRAAGASSMRDAQLRKQRAHAYHQQAMSLAKGLAAGAAQGPKEDFSAPVYHLPPPQQQHQQQPPKKPRTTTSIGTMMSSPQLQMHQAVGVPRRHPYQVQYNGNNNGFVVSGMLQVKKHEEDTRAPKAHIYNVGVDILVQCLSFLDPREVLSVVTCPLSKTWRQVYCKQDHLWKVLCLAEPFHARLGSSNSTSGGSGDGDDSLSMSTSSTASEMKSIFGQYRLLYTSFVRCIAYVHKIQREALIQSKKSPPLTTTTQDGNDDSAGGDLAVTSLTSSRSPSASGANQVIQVAPAQAQPRHHHQQQELPPSLGNFLARSRAAEASAALQHQERASSFAGTTLQVDSGAESPQSSLSNSCLSSSCSDSSDEGSVYDLSEPRAIARRNSSSSPFAAAAATSSSQSKKDGPSACPAPVTAPKYGHSKLTAGLLGTSSAGRPNTASKSINAKQQMKKQEPGHVDLPWSCAVYAVINWMVAFSDVLGIQVACLKVLPALLEDERQRSTAQLAGLTGIVIRAMVCFKDSVELHTASFHTLVLLARPLGGKEGMLFHRTMVGGGGGAAREEQNPNYGGAQPQQQQQQHQPRGIFDIGSASAGGQGSMVNGTAVIIESMRRFAKNESLQAMACWSMVNIALIPSQKSMLVRLGGIGVTAQAMMMHPLSAEVQFRALFALINLVIPCEQSNTTGGGLGIRVSVEKEMLDESVGQIAHLVVAAMKNFCTTKAILNRACLVLHNLSLNREYHSTLLWAPNCYEMVQWTMANYPNDRVIEQSTSGTLQRLQQTLREDDDLRLKFSAWLNAPVVPEIASAAPS